MINPPAKLLRIPRTAALALRFATRQFRADDEKYLHEDSARGLRARQDAILDWIRERGGKVDYR